MNFKSFGCADHEHFTIELRPTTKCNYNCYYCTDLHINSNPVRTLDSDHIIKLIESIKNNLNMPVHVYICGGEPTLYSGLNTLVSRISSHMEGLDYITIQTNLSKPLSWIKTFCNDIHKQTTRVKLNCSYHNTQEKNLLSYISRCLYIKSVNMLGVVSLAYNQVVDVMNDYQKMVSMLGDSHCEIVPLINASVDQDNKKGNNSDADIDLINDRYSESELEPTGHFFKKTLQYTDQKNVIHKISRNQMWLTRMNNFKDYSCSISKFKIYVDWDGNCFSCFNYQFSKKPPVFHISMTDRFDDYFSKNECIDCPFTTCFFDLEYLKQSQDKIVETERIDRKYNTHEHRLIKYE